MIIFDSTLTPRDADAAADLPRLTYFVLETHEDCILTPLENADEYSIHIGLPDRPDQRHGWKFSDLGDALTQLDALHAAYPHAALWLSTGEILAEMVGDSIGEGFANAMAEVDPDDEDCEWVQLSRILTRTGHEGVSPRRAIRDWLSGRDVSDAVGDAIDHL